MFTYPDELNPIFDLFQSNGYQLHFVGGCVRDMLLSKTPNDFDLTTSATPNEVKQLLSSYKTIDTGIAHGTVTLLLNHHPYEITTYRFEGSYKDHRHPDSVSFSKTIDEDLSRRDFTINAMAFCPGMNLVDLFDGEKDLEHKLIRTVGEAYQRFDEDALRILRALRFSSTLSFDIEEKTQEAIVSLLPTLSYVSKERIHDELLKMFEGGNLKNVLLHNVQFLQFLFPPLIDPLKQLNAFFSSLDTLPKDPLLRLASLLSVLPKENAEEFLKTYRFSNEHSSFILSLLKYKDLTPTLSNSSIQRFLYIIKGKQLFDPLVKLHLANEVEAPLWQKISDIAKKLLESNAIISLSQLDVTGNILQKECGIEPSKTKECLETLLFAVMEEKVQNKKEQLINYIKKDIMP